MGVFCSQLSNEYALAAKHFELSRGDLIGLCHDAVGMIFTDEEEKWRLRAVLDAFGAEES